MAWDLIVVGGGSAGLTAATIAGRVGARVLLVDKTELGGDCLHTGCVPSKALIRCAKAAHHARTAGRFGVNTGPVEVDFDRVMAHVRHAIDHIAEHDSPEALGRHGVEVAFGGATLLKDSRVRIGKDRVEQAERILIATGSHSAPPSIPGLEDVGFIDHVGVFALKALPPRLVVIGAGPIGVEMGQSFARLGAEVTLLELGPRILPRDDEDLAHRLTEALAREMTLHFGASTTGMRREGADKVVQFQVDGTLHEVRCDEVLVAVGRRANTAGMGLEDAGVTLEKGFVVVDKYQRTTAPHVYAAGDCCGPYQFTHFAEAQARVAARNALFRGRSAFGTPHVPWVTFADPELAHVGLTEAEARLQRGDVQVYAYEYERLDRAVCEGEVHGLGKVVTDDAGKILGASILGPGAGEAIATVVAAMDSGRSLSDLGGTVFAYPTLTRVVRRLADERFLAEGVSPFVARWFGRFDAS